MSLYNIGMFILAKASWIMKPLYTISLFLDGVMYSVVSYVYKIFMLMSQIKFSRIFDMMEPLIDRVKAVIIVLVLYKLGRSLIEYMINPAKATDDKSGGAALVKNLFITAALLILYPFLFGVMNDISLLIIGSEDGDYEYLGQLIDTVGGNDEGLLIRFVWGSSGAAKDVDMGEWLAHETLTLFLHDQDSTGSGITTTYVDEHALKINVKDGATYNFTEAHNIVDDIGVNVEYTLPFVSSIMGFYLIYSIAKVAIEIGVRMFKLIILQILAPLAIVTIIDKGTSSKTLQTFLQTYISVFLEAITRIAIVYIITTFVAAFIGDITSYFGDVASIQESLITRGLICIIVLVAGYKVIGILPKFIDEALGTKMASSAGGGGFGKFAAGLIGGAIGGAVGLGSGLATGIAGGAGFTGTIANMVGGAAGGVRSGIKGKNIAEYFKNQSANSQANRDRAQRFARQGGGLRMLGHNIESGLGIPQRRAMQAQKNTDTATALDNMMNARMAAISEVKDGNDDNAIKFGSSADEYASKKIETDVGVQTARAKYEQNKTQENYISYVQAREKAISKYKTAYNNALFKNDDVNDDKTVKEATKVYDRRNTDSNYSSENMASSNDAGGVVKEAKKNYLGKASKYSNKGSSRRANRQNIYGGK